MTPEEIATMKAENEAIKAENAKTKADLEALKNPKPDPNKPDPNKPDPSKEDDLQEKARKEKEKADKENQGMKKLEGALKFNMGVSEFVKTNKDLLPADVEGILRQAEKENYDTASEKANAIKVGIIGAFFTVQANVDMLTSAQKSQLEDFQKLTKNGKEEKAEHIFENIFEPALETFKKIKKAEELGKSRAGMTGGSSTENEYKNRLMNQAKRIHLKEKGE